MKISILIPTLDNPAYLKCLLDSIKAYTVVDYEILIYYNTVKNNLGLSKAINLLGKKAVGDFIFYPNDDMYLAPGWDEALLNAVNPNIHYQYLTAAMFEPQYENVCMNSPMDYGRTPLEFHEQRFLNGWKKARKIKEDVVSPYCPIFVTKALWDEVGGYDEAYFPCFGTDPDFAAKIYFTAKKAGKPYEFRAVADAGVYHFQCITTDKIPNDASYRAQAASIFKSKWGMDWGTFYKQHLQIGKKCGF
jgi:glycosyltransferase involved in cell wall biosynthesis